MKNTRLYVEKKNNFDTLKRALLSDFNENLNLNLENIRVFNIYDIFNIEDDLLDKSINLVFSEINTDNVYFNLDFDLNKFKYLATELLPGQFDQRADSARQCLNLIKENDVTIKSAELIVFFDDISKDDLIKIKKYYINEIESREKDLSKLQLEEYHQNKEFKLDCDFINLDDKGLSDLYNNLNLAMSLEDFKYIKDYFKNEEKRNPNFTEIKLLDTYWSDHCRHTTFETKLNNITYSNDELSNVIKKTFEEYLKMRKELKRENKEITLMDMAKINSLYEYQKGNLNDLEISEENNACSIITKINNEEYLIMFKNETHNHPTEIEPFGGASTCIGGAIRDPLSGRSYVYQALRITGSGDITKDISSTVKGKLPQRVISKKAALGYSSYGNQIGLSTTFVKEIFHEGYIAKRLELGCVVGCAKKENVIREKPDTKDVVVMLGGRTGRDGIGGATGSSKSHNIKSLELSSSEVQKGNAPEERKIQRLFRNPLVSKIIKKSNDFGAGGISVAIGELSEGLLIYLDRVKTKYYGLNVTELALSESQERMAVVIKRKDLDVFLKYCHNENIEAYHIADITNTNRLQMIYHNELVVDINRDFLNTNGIRQEADVYINSSIKDNPYKNEVKDIYEALSNLNVASLRGLVNMFDSTIGSSTVLFPYGGKYLNSEEVASVQKINTLNLNHHKCSIVAYGYDPYVFSINPYIGAINSIIESISRIVSVGGNYKNIRFSLQEYFPKLNNNEKWGMVTQSLLGSIYALKKFNLASIGGKDSMSGTFNNLEVPPTLVSFGLCIEDIFNIKSRVLKDFDNYLYIIETPYLDNYLPDIDKLKEYYDYLYEIKDLIISSRPVLFMGVVEALVKSSFGNKIGFNINYDKLYDKQYGSIIIETKNKINNPYLKYLGETIDKIIINNKEYIIDDLLNINESTFNKIYPIYSNKNQNLDLSIIKEGINKKFKPLNKKEVNVLIPVFPGTNCDYDMYNKFQKEGGICKFFVFKNLTNFDILESIKEFSKEINNTDILVLSGGFSMGDEPDGSGKFIANILNNKKIKSSVNKLLKRKGLILGICNGFQALIKSGYLPNMTILNKDSPTLFKNDINIHQSVIKKTKINTTNSPWLEGFKIGDINTICFSHGELFDNNQVAFLYVDDLNNPTMDPKYNPNGSYYAIEGIISKDGLILGKMGHSERYEEDTLINVSGNKNQNIFKNAINYFKGEN